MAEIIKYSEFLIQKSIRRHIENLKKQNKGGEKMKMFKLLDGKKTYISAFLMVLLSGLKAQGYLDEQTYQLVFGLLVAAGLASLRMGVNK